MSDSWKPVGSWDSCTYCGEDFKMGITPWNIHGYCSQSCEAHSIEFRDKKYKEELHMAKKKQVTTQDIKDAQAKSEAKEAAQTETPATPATPATDTQTPATGTTEEKKEAAPKKEAGPAKMAHGAVQDKGNPPTEALPDGWQYVWHDAYTYDGKNGPVTVRGHWEKAKKSPPKPKAAEKKAEAPATGTPATAGTETPKESTPATSGSSQSEQK